MIKISLENGPTLSFESKLSSKDRDRLPDSAYGLPKERKYPLNDANHVKSAIRFFKNCPDNQKHILAIRICRAAKKYGVEISKDSDVYKWAYNNSK